MCPTKVNFDWANSEIGGKMANMANCYFALCTPYSINPYITIIKTNIPYNRPAFLVASCLNSEYTSSYTLIRVRN